MTKNLLGYKSRGQYKQRTTLENDKGDRWLLDLLC